MHNDIICQVVEVNVTRVVNKGDIPTALAGGGGSVQITQPGLDSHVRVASFLDQFSSHQLDHVMPVP